MSGVQLISPLLTARICLVVYELFYTMLFCKYGCRMDFLKSNTSCIVCIYVLVVKTQYVPVFCMLIRIGGIKDIYIYKWDLHITTTLNIASVEKIVGKVFGE